MICNARLSGDRLGSTSLTFEPHSPVRPGFYEFNVADARTGGSAGAATLVLQTVLLPLALATGSSVVTVKGGTHVPWSPSFHYLRDVFLMMASSVGAPASAELLTWGWYPVGGGEIKVTIPGQARLTLPVRQTRGNLQRISGIAVAANLPAHIAQRMRDRAMNLLRQADLPAQIEPTRVASLSPGAGIFLVAEYEGGRAGFSALGEKGKPSEQVAQEAVDDLLSFHYSGALLDVHLADQLILPLALAGQPLALTTEGVSKHTLTNIWVVEQFLGPVAQVEQSQGIIEFIQRERVLG
jgi:RNA 3'-terminal phosphate cyclase (ATP)